MKIKWTKLIQRIWDKFVITNNNLLTLLTIDH